MAWTFYNSDGQRLVKQSSGGVSLTGSTDNTITTVTGACAIAGEANLTWNGAMLQQGAADAMPLLSGTWASNYSGYMMNAYYSGGWKYAGDDYAMGIRFHGAGGFSGSMLFNVTPSANTSGAGATISTWDCATATSGSIKMVLDKCGALYLGDCANANVTTGLTLNQGAADNEILALKSSDVAHGVTECAETDTYLKIQKNDGPTGGALIYGFGESDVGMFIRATSATDTTTKAASGGTGYLNLRVDKSCSVSYGAAGSNANLVTIRTAATYRFIFDAEGSGHSDVEWTTYDDYQDIELLRGVHGALKPDFKKDFGQDMLYNLCTYTDLGLVGKDSLHWEERDCGRMQQRAMVNWTGLSMLHHSAIIQLADRVDARLTALESQIALQGGK